ncbi:uncharacterized protein LOC100623157 isoform X8 [Sus scrofa]|uniref:uncharacterized protein LOC100623157 isoform X8 n=1 Tax=Sus scrofa TaxID=9823 RepID=UPI000A2B9949|nr:uncharacterized protein LOC100623157 isoform X8 [Sus scrofa]
MLGGRGWGRRGACPRAFAGTAAIRSRCLRLGSSEHCGLEGCSAQRGGRGRGRCAAAPRIAVGLPSPPLKLRRVRARGREAEARDLAASSGVIQSLVESWEACSSSNSYCYKPKGTGDIKGCNPNISKEEEKPPRGTEWGPGRLLQNPCQTPLVLLLLHP